MTYNDEIFFDQQLVESEAVAKNTRSRLKELGIPFYRMSPHLDEVIPSGETDTGKLLDMVMKVGLHD